MAEPNRRTGHERQHGAKTQPYPRTSPRSGPGRAPDGDRQVGQRVKDGTCQPPIPLVANQHTGVGTGEHSSLLLQPLDIPGEPHPHAGYKIGHQSVLRTHTASQREAKEYNEAKYQGASAESSHSFHPVSRGWIGFDKRDTIARIGRPTE